MFLLLLWIAVFLDVLDGFSLPLSYGRVTKRYPTITAMASTKRDVTLVLPTFVTDDDADEADGEYPSPLHKIYVEPFLLEEEAETICKMATEFAEQTGRWDSPDQVRHQSYATCDFPIDECSTIEEYFDKIDFDGRLFERMATLYGIDVEDLSYLDLFCVRYEAKQDPDAMDSEVMDRLEAHRDGSLLSFSLLLNTPDHFEGGGTFYEGLRGIPPSGILHSGGVIRPERAGDIVLHCGKVLHGADVVTSGYRIVLVGFVDVDERCQRPGALAKACTAFGRMDVAQYRYKRQAEKQHKGWVLKTDRWVHGHSHVRGYAPAFGAVLRRGNPDFQRQRKLEAEDMLLRSILLPEEDRLDPWEDPISTGEITILDDEQAQPYN
jgi:hypothetical protein